MTTSQHSTREAGATPRPRPGGRSARVRASVHRAVGELLAQAPAESLTIPAVATRAGVHPTTVYRRWPTLAELLADVAASRFSGDIVVPDTGSLRGDLERWATDVAIDLADPDVLALMRAAVGAAGPDGGDACVADRHEQLTAMLERERARGGPDDGSDRGPGGDPATVPSTDEAADALLGPLYYRAVFTARPGEPGWARGLVGRLLAGRG
ncbi:TetR/AcrR family transcriptional regulator [Pseudonocardia sp. KRD291]|uniref:TetR/AcrR family transcriptional regulator n=1 Tax=Pseudonocardia sp. KRD291 TaxID=2792007 RepID=UPI001C4A4461|nr:TetR/AcrR family transcriptional regulator [Pseudonocardia sp. KRD291]MBW0101942.1 TetR/AcrR family transcriptional regulator [Pseudonocardia sp. KRD291]